jgi:hypothetical protein
MFLEGVGSAVCHAFSLQACSQQDSLSPILIISKEDLIQADFISKVIYAKIYFDAHDTGAGHSFLCQHVDILACSAQR